MIERASSTLAMRNYAYCVPCTGALRFDTAVDTVRSMGLTIGEAKSLIHSRGPGLRMLPVTTIDTDTLT